jgi:hypothetical protein
MTGRQEPDVMPTDPRASFCVEMRRLIESHLSAFDSSIASQAARSNWLGPQGDALSDSACREALRSMLKAELASMCVAIAAALDGATAMSDGEQPVLLTDRSGNTLTGLHDALIGYFEEKLFTR